MLLKLIRFCIVFIIVPEFVGLGILSFKKENKNMIFALIIGYLLEFAIFEALAIPMIFMHTTFMTLVYIWSIIMVILTVLSIVRIKDYYKDIIAENIKEIKSLPKLFTTILLVIVLLQAFVAFKYMHEDYDDSNFVGKATITYDTNTLYEYSDTGSELSEVPSRNGLSPYPVFTATMAKLVGTHPAIMAHTIFPAFFIIFAYGVYYLIGKALFKDNKTKTMVFLIILAVLYMFGDYTRYSVFVRLLYRLWQGKSMLCAIILPFIWYIFIKYIGKENDKFYWIILLITLWGTDLLSSMSLFLPTISVGILTVIYMIKDKKPKYLLYMIICFIPSIAYGLTYLSIK